MSINIAEEYIYLTKRLIKEYMNLVLGKKFNKQYCELFTERYVNIRYYNFYENDIGITLRKKILDHLKKTEEEIAINNISDRDIAEQMRIFFYYVLYFDDVTYYRNLDDIIKKIVKLRKKILKLETREFEKELEKVIKKNRKEKNDLLKRFESEEFTIKLSNYKDKLNVYRVNLQYNIEFPMEYSAYAIKKAFTTGLIDEDRLIIEYYLTVIKIIKDVIKHNYKKHYIVEFAVSLFEKSKKIKNLLKIINNAMIQDKISLKIRYEDFLENKEKIYELMRDGFNFSIVLDKTFEVNYKNIEKLKMFKYVLVNQNLTYCDEIIGDNVINI